MCRGRAGRARPDGAPWTLRFLLQATDDPSLLVPAGQVWQERGPALRPAQPHPGRPPGLPPRRAGARRALFPPLARSLRGPRPETCSLSPEEAYAFLRDAGASLEALGFPVLVPNLSRSVTLRARLRPQEDPAATRSTWRILRPETIVRFDWRVALGGQEGGPGGPGPELSGEEFAALAALKEPLVQVRGQWVVFESRVVEQALSFFERHGAGGELGLAEALSLALSPPDPGAAAGRRLPPARSRQHCLSSWTPARKYSNCWTTSPPATALPLRRSRRPAPARSPPDFWGAAPLPEAGVAWLAALRRYGLGACLADDMGLGKTPS